MLKKLLCLLFFTFSLGCDKEQISSTISTFPNISSSSTSLIPSSSIKPSSSPQESTSSSSISISESTFSSSSSFEEEIKEIKYRILLISGHGNGDPGATYKNRLESKYNQEFVDLLTTKINNTKNKIEILHEPYEMKASQEAELISKSNVDFVLNIHFNAGGGKGSEMIVPFYEKDFSFAYNFFDKLQDNNFLLRETSVYSKSNSKRIKRNKFDKAYNYDDYFAVIRSGSKKKIPSYILEVEFIDNLSQMKIYDERKDIYISLLAESIIEYYN